MAIKTVQMRAEWTENPGEFYRELGLSMAACLALVREACMLAFHLSQPLARLLPEHFHLCPSPRPTLASGQIKHVCSVPDMSVKPRDTTKWCLVLFLKKSLK